MDREATARFFTDAAVWQKMVDVFVEDNLIAGWMVPQGASQVEFSRKIASDVVAHSGNHGDAAGKLGRCIHQISCRISK
jgi:hypothetical protein